MFKGERPTIEGKHYRVKDAINSPATIRGDIPIMIGGSGEKKTMRLGAQYAEMVNLTVGADEVPRKLDALAKHCADLGRDMDTINKTALGIMVHGDTMEAAEAKRNAFLAEHGGLSWDALDDGTRTMLSARILLGDDDTIGEGVQRLLDLGLDGVTVSLPADGHIPEAVTAAGRALSIAVS